MKYIRPELRIERFDNEAATAASTLEGFENAGVDNKNVLHINYSEMSKRVKFVL